MAKKNEYIIKLEKPYTFEGTEYNEIDLSGLEKLTVKDLVEAEKQFTASGQAAAVAEMSIGYAAIVAVMVTKKPVEFFNGLPAKEGVKVKTMVSSFFLLD